MSRPAPYGFGSSPHSNQMLSYTPVSSKEPIAERRSTINLSKDEREQVSAGQQQPGLRERKIVGVLLDLLCLLLCVSIIVFGGFVRKNNGVEMGTDQRQLLNISQIGTTIFPYLFALIVGRGLKNLLNWRLGKGVKIVNFTYLSKCSTLANAFIIPLTLRIFHWIPLALVAVWVFSPLGSQSILRSTSELQIVQSTETSVLYYYPATSGYTSSGDAQTLVNTANALLFSSLLSVGNSLHQSQDTFGNIKVPTLSPPNGYSDSSDWIKITAPATYSSLIGVPFVKPTNQGNSTFTMRSWYWHLTDPIVSLYISSNSPAYPGLPIAEEGWKNYTATSGYWHFLVPNSTDFRNSSASLTVPIMFENANPDNPEAVHRKALNDTARDAGITRLSANLTHHPVEMQVFCSTQSCHTTAIRPSELVDSHSVESNFQFFTLHFLFYLTKAFPLNHPGTPEYDAFNFFLNESSASPFATHRSGELPDLASLGATELAYRLELVINAYWIAHSALAGVVNLDNLNMSEYLLANQKDLLFANATATLLDPQTVFRCDYRWLTVLFIATIVMMAAAATSLTFGLLYDGPEVCDFTSALMRSYRMPELGKGNYMSGDDLVRQLRDVPIKVGDASVEDDIGRIVIGPQYRVRNLVVGRFYG